MVGSSGLECDFDLRLGFGSRHSVAMAVVGEEVLAGWVVSREEVAGGEPGVCQRGGNLVKVCVREWVSQ